MPTIPNPSAPSTTANTAGAPPLLAGLAGFFANGAEPHAFDPLDLAFDAARVELHDSAALDLLAERIDRDNQLSLDLSERLGTGPGGRTDRPPPPLAWLVASRNPNVRPQRRAGVDGFAGASDETAARCARFVYLHRSRGLTPTDYAWQREWTVARAVGFGFWTAPGVVSRSHDLSDLAASAILGAEETPARRRFVAMLATADRLGWNGTTLSGPELARLLGCGVSTVWEVVKWAERRGIAFRMRRYKPGRNGKPVALSANWYGFGPALMAHRRLYAPTLEEREEGPPRDALDRLRGVRRRQRYRHRRTRRAIAVRRAGMVLAAVGSMMPTRQAFAAELLDGLEHREAVRAEVARAAVELDASAAAIAARVLASDAPDISAALEAMREARGAHARAAETARDGVPSSVLEEQPGEAALREAAACALEERPGRRSLEPDPEPRRQTVRRSRESAPVSTTNTPSDRGMVRHASGICAGKDRARDPVGSPAMLEHGNQLGAAVPDRARGNAGRAGVTERAPPAAGLAAPAGRLAIGAQAERASKFQANAPPGSPCTGSPVNRCACGQTLEAHRPGFGWCPRCFALVGIG